MFHSCNLHHRGERWFFELRYVQLSGFNAGYDQELAGFWSKFCIVVRRCFMWHPIKGDMIGCDSNICRILHINIMWTTTRRSFSIFPNRPSEMMITTITRQQLWQWWSLWWPWWSLWWCGYIDYVCAFDLRWQWGWRRRAQMMEGVDWNCTSH